MYTLFGQSISLIECFAMASGIIGVWLTLKENPWCFPVGIVNVGLYAWLFFDPSVRLYADAGLQIVYLFLLAYGWYAWTRKQKDQAEELAITLLSKNEKWAILLASVAVTVVLGYFFSHFTNAALPWLDSGLSAVSLAAQWMVARKKIENWIAWMIADAVYIPLYLYKHLPLTAVLYLAFLVLAIRGYFEWRSNLSPEQLSDE